jgi:uncharacterized protein YbbC (DUF1343 family)
MLENEDMGLSQFQSGFDRFVREKSLRKSILGKRVALLAHPASMSYSNQSAFGFEHSMDVLLGLAKETREFEVTAAFGPQHGMRGEKQDNMEETENYIDPTWNIPVFSLYGDVRRPTKEMLETFDVLLVDLQDVGTRIYTFVTTLLYVMEAGAKFGKRIIVLDRPNPAGRPVEGTLLEPGFISFVGAAEGLPMRHGLTLGELGRWFKSRLSLNVEYEVVEMSGYDPNSAPGFGWPLQELAWVNPSPNAASLSMARAFPGTVLIEGTHLSEGRGTTRPLETVGADQLEPHQVLQKMRSLAPDWMKGCLLRPTWFLPTFQKYAGKIVGGFQVHLDTHHYDHEMFKPYRLIALWLKAIRELDPEYQIWRDFHYEYERNRLAIDLINGGPALREWVDGRGSLPHEFDARLKKDEAIWLHERQSFLLY